MELFETIARRHSYRGTFEAQPVPRDDLRRIVQAGMQAPSAKNAQTTSFVIVDEPATIAAVTAIIEHPVGQTAPAMIVCVVDPRPAGGEISFAAEDCAAAVENMLLAITALGYASVWLDGVLRRHRRAERVAELLGVPGDRQVRIVLPVGVPHERAAQVEKKPFDERAWFNRHGGIASA